MKPSLRLLAALVLSAGASVAQQDDAELRPQREEAFRMVDAYVVSHLQEGLGLTDEEFAKVVPLVSKLQRGRREYLIGRARLLREMRRLLRQGGAVESQVVERLQEARKLDKEGLERIRGDVEALDAVLTPLQQAKYRVLEGDVEQRMRELASRIRANRPGQRPRGAQPPED